MAEKIIYVTQKNMKYSAERTLNMVQKKICFKRCRKIWNIGQKNINYNTEKIIHMAYEDVKYCAEKY